MPAGVWNITLEQGVTWRTVVTVEDSDGAPVDLTGATARMHIRENLDSPTPLLALTNGSGITVGGAAGKLVLLLTDEQTAAITWRYAVYDLEIETGGGEVSRILKGQVEVDREVTR